MMKKSISRALLIAPLVFFVGSCSKNDFPSYSSLDRLKILALVVDRPEIQNPSAGVHTVSLTPYVSDVGGQGDLKLDVQACLDPGVSLGASPNCETGLFKSDKITVTVSEANSQPADVFAALTRTGRPLTGAISVPLTVPANFLSQFPASFQNNGVPYLIVVTVSTADASRSVTAFRRVLVSTKTPNNNPTLTEFKADDQVLSVLPTGLTRLSFEAGESPESFNFLRGDGASSNLEETYEVAWFVSDGSVDPSRTRLGEFLEWTPPTAAPSGGRPVVVVGVLRDGRGGVSVLIRHL